jgi:hypothetical protein
MNSETTSTCAPLLKKRAPLPLSSGLQLHPAVRMWRRMHLRIRRLNRLAHWAMWLRALSQLHETLFLPS